MKPLQILEPNMTPQTGCAKINECRNRFEIMANWGTPKADMAQWAHEALNRWLCSRMDSTSPSGYDSEKTVKGNDHG